MSLFLHGKEPKDPTEKLKRRMGGLQSLCERSEEQKNLLSPE